MAGFVFGRKVAAPYIGINPRCRCWGSDGFGGFGWILGWEGGRGAGEPHAALGSLGLPDAWCLLSRPCQMRRSARPAPAVSTLVGPPRTLFLGRVAPDGVLGRGCTPTPLDPVGRRPAEPGEGDHAKDILPDLRQCRIFGGSAQEKANR